VTSQHVTAAEESADSEARRIMVKTMLRQLRDGARAFHKDEQGAEMLEYILIFAAIALPVLGVVIYFWKDIRDWALQKWEDTKGDIDDPMN